MPKNGFAPLHGSPRRRRPVSARTAAVFTITIPPGGARFPLLIPSAPGCVWASPFPPAAVRNAHWLSRFFPPPQSSGIYTNFLPFFTAAPGCVWASPFPPAAVRNAHWLSRFFPRRGSHSSPRGVRGWRKWRGDERTQLPGSRNSFFKIS